MGDVSTRPLHLVTDNQLKGMATSAAKNVLYSLGDLSEEMRYREQRRIARWVAWLVGGTLLINVIGIVVNVIL